MSAQQRNATPSVIEQYDKLREELVGLEDSVYQALVQRGHLRLDEGGKYDYVPGVSNIVTVRDAPEWDSVVGRIDDLEEHLVQVEFQLQDRGMQLRSSGADADVYRYTLLRGAHSGSGDASARFLQQVGRADMILEEAGLTVDDLVIDVLPTPEGKIRNTSPEQAAAIERFQTVIDRLRITNECSGPPPVISTSQLAPELKPELLAQSRVARLGQGERFVITEIKSGQAGLLQMDEIADKHHAIRRWQEEQGQIQYPDILDSRPDLINADRVFVEPGGKLWVATDAATDEIVGFVGLKRNSDGTGEVKHLAVDPKAHGRRIGTQLMEGLTAWASESGITELQVSTNKLERAKPIYERFGFKVTGYDAARNDYHMTLAVTPALQQNAGRTLNSPEQPGPSFSGPGFGMTL